MRIFKYHVPPYGKFKLRIDGDVGKFMKLDYQGHSLVAWFLVCPSERITTLNMRSAYTGDDVHTGSHEYYGSVFNPNTGLATHLFQDLTGVEEDD